MAPLHRSVAPQAQAQAQGEQLQIQHFTHPHLLHKVFMGFDFNCDGCKTSGYGLRYRCSACDFDLHEQCGTSPHRLSSHLHPHHQLNLVIRPGNSHFCDVCRGYANGLSYSCETCGFDVHPLCTQIPSLTLNHCQQQGGVAPMVAFGGHHGVMNNNQPINHQYQYQQQQQGIPFGCYNNGMNNNQPEMMMNQQQGIPFGGYNNGMMMNQQQQQQGRSNNYSKVGKFAANVLMTSLIGVPLNFSSKK